jgi:hypothetical protein
MRACLSDQAQNTAPGRGKASSARANEVGVLRTRAVAGFDDCVHQQTPVSGEERPVFTCHYVEQLIVLRLGIVGGIKSKQA